MAGATVLLNLCLITSTTNLPSLTICEEDPSPVNLILTATQGTPNITIEFTINGSSYSSTLGDI